MTRKISIFLIFVLMPQIVLAGQHNGLKALIDDYQYFLSVEWDQKDPVSFEAAKESFQADLTQILESGARPDDIASAIGLEQMPTASLDVKNAHEVTAFILKHQKRQEGASWNGEILGPMIIIGVVISALTAFVLYARKKNQAFSDCVEANGGLEESCIQR